MTPRQRWSAVLTDLQALHQLAVHTRHLDLPADLRSWLGQKQRSLQSQQPRRLAYAGRRGHYIAGPLHTPQPWLSRGCGASALCFAALNPNVWLDLRPGRSRRAFHASITAALESLARIDSDLANAFAFGAYRDSPGMHLRMADGKVQMQWRPAAGFVLNVSSP